MSLNKSTTLRDALKSWVDEGLVSPESASILTERYELDAGLAWYRNTTFMIGIVASFLVAAGIVLLISENWHRLGIPTRMATGIVPWFVASFLTVRALIRKQHRQEEVWGTLTTLLFGANIFLQAQIFHLSGFWPTAIMWWAAGAFAMALVLRSPTILILTHALVTIWIDGETSNGQLNPLVLIGVVAVVLAAWRQLSRLTLTSSIIVFGYGLSHVAISMNGGVSEPLFNLAIIMFSAAVYAWAYPVSPRFRDIMIRILSAVSVLITAIYFGSIKNFQSEYHIESWQRHDPWFPAVLASVGVALLIFRRRDWLSIGLCCVTMLIVVFSFVDARYTFIAVYGVNVLLLATAIAMVWSGMKNMHKLDFMSGLVLIIALALSRYGDYFNDYLVGAGIFVGSGILLFAANLYWRKLYATH